MKKLIVLALAAALSVAATGAVEAKKAPKELTFYLHFPSEAGTCGASFMDLDEAFKDSGCGYTAQPANEVLTAAGSGLARDWPATAGVPFKLDATRPLTAEMHLNSFLGTAASGYAIVEFSLSGTIGGRSTTIAEDVVEVAMPGVPGTSVAAFEIELDKKLNGKKVTSLNLTTSVRGVNNFHYFDLEGSPAHIIVPSK